MGFLSALFSCSKPPTTTASSFDFTVEEVFYIKPPVDRVVLVGTVKQGRVVVGDHVTVHCQTAPVLASIEGIETLSGNLQSASTGQQVGLRLTGIAKDQASKGDRVTASEALSVSVQANGDIRINDAPTNVAELDVRLAALTKAGGEVWYYREAAQGDPHPNAMHVMELVIKHRLPITFSSKPDFSDYVDAQGVSHPRR
jgi:hypothetical protein